MCVHACVCVRACGRVCVRACMRVVRAYTCTLGDRTIRAGQSRPDGLISS